MAASGSDMFRFIGKMGQQGSFEPIKESLEAVIARFNNSYQPAIERAYFATAKQLKASLSAEVAGYPVKVIADNNYAKRKLYALSFLKALRDKISVLSPVEADFSPTQISIGEIKFQDNVSEHATLAKHHLGSRGLSRIALLTFEITTMLPGGEKKCDVLVVNLGNRYPVSMGAANAQLQAMGDITSAEGQAGIGHSYVAIINASDEPGKALYAKLSPQAKAFYHLLSDCGIAAAEMAKATLASQIEQHKSEPQYAAYAAASDVYLSNAHAAYANTQSAYAGPDDFPSSKTL